MIPNLDTTTFSEEDIRDILLEKGIALRKTKGFDKPFEIVKYKNETDYDIIYAYLNLDELRIWLSGWLYSLFFNSLEKNPCEKNPYKILKEDFLRKVGGE